MKIPSEICVLGLFVKVILKNPVFSEEGRIISGSFDSKNRIIELDSEMDQRDLVQTFLHEVGHVILYRTAVSPLVINSKVEEIVVDSYSTVLLELFKMEPL